MLAKLDNKNTQTVISALIKQSKKLPNELYKSLTWDRGSELTDHQHFTLATDIKVYKSIFVTHKVRGNAALMKIPIVY
jgi:IS30 family transposase